MSPLTESLRAHADVLLPRYERRPHVTVAYAGLLPTPGATPAEQFYGPDRLARDILTLRRLAVRPFRVQVGGWGSFPMVPYLSAGAPAQPVMSDSLLPG